MLVVRHAGQAGVERHHDEGELQQGTEQAGSLPRESGLQIKLWEREGNKQNKKKKGCVNLPKMRQQLLCGCGCGVATALWLREGELSKRKDAPCTCVGSGFLTHGEDEDSGGWAQTPLSEPTPGDWDALHPSSASASTQHHIRVKKFLPGII